MCGVGDSSVVLIIVSSGFTWHWPRVVIHKLYLSTHLSTLSISHIYRLVGLGQTTVPAQYAIYITIYQTVGATGDNE